jgi:hypothetical protein
MGDRKQEHARSGVGHDLDENLEQLAEQLRRPHHDDEERERRRQAAHRAGESPRRQGRGTHTVSH